MDAGWHRLDPHLRDPLPDVRTNAKAALEKMPERTPYALGFLERSGRTAAKDAKAQKWLKTFELDERIRMNFRSIQSSFNSDSHSYREQRTSPARRNNAHTTHIHASFDSVGGGVGGWIHVHVDRSRRIFSAEIAVTRIRK
jgi:hypothetical protein